MTSQRPRFLLVRYAPGSAGKFLMSLLMCSKDVAHYDPFVKTDKDMLDYITNSFPKEIGLWLKKEPSDALAWNINFVSNKYPRGDDLDDETFWNLCEERCTPWFHECVSAGKRIMIPWHKETIPSFYEGDVVTIYLDKDSLGWFARAVWAKHHGCVDGKIHLKDHDPEFYRGDKSVYSKYNNPIYTDEGFVSFTRREIYRSPKALLFSDRSRLGIIDHQVMIDLKDVLNKDNLKLSIKMICEKLQIAQVDPDIISQGFDHWISCHEF